MKMNADDCQHANEYVTYILARGVEEFARYNTIGIDPALILQEYFRLISIGDTAPTDTAPADGVIGTVLDKLDELDYVGSFLEVFERQYRYRPIYQHYLVLVEQDTDLTLIVDETIRQYRQLHPNYYVTRELLSEQLNPDILALFAENLSPQGQM